MKNNKIQAKVISQNKNILIIAISTFLTIFSLFFANISKAEEIPTLNSTEFLTLLGEEKGKVILVNFFASWCPPCREEVVDLNAIREKYNTDEVYIIGLSLDESMQDLEKFLEEIPLNYPVYQSDIQIALAFNVSAIPHNVIYNKELKPVYNDAGIVTEEFLTEVFDIEVNK